MRDIVETAEIKEKAENVNCTQKNNLKFFWLEENDIICRDLNRCEYYRPYSHPRGEREFLCTLLGWKSHYQS